MQLITSKSGRTWLLGAALLSLSLNGSTQAFAPTVHLHAHGGRVRFKRLGGRKRGELYGGGSGGAVVDPWDEETGGLHKFESRVFIEN